MSQKFTLGKNERLKSRKVIEELFSKGKSFVVHPIRVTYNIVGKDLQMGAGVSSRNFKKAVDRNRIKRLIRESYRLQKHVLSAKLKESNTGMVIFFTCLAKEIPDYQQLYVSMNKALQKLAAL